MVTHLVALEDPVAAVDTRQQVVFQLGVGSPASEVPIVSIPVTYYIDSAVGHLAPWVFPLPSPRFVSGLSRVAIRCTDNISAIRSYGPVKIVYNPLPYT